MMQDELKKLVKDHNFPEFFSRIRKVSLTSNEEIMFNSFRYSHIRGDINDDLLASKLNEFVDQLSHFKEMDSELVSLDFLENENNIGLAFIDYINRDALDLYKNKIYSQEYKSIIWKNMWSDDDFQSQKKYLKTIIENGEAITEKIRHMLLEMSKIDKINIWIIGNAGIGKTTSLYNIFFCILLDKEKEEKLPSPLLIQPRLFKSSQVEELEGINNKKDFMELFLDFFISNRNIEISKNIRTKLVNSIQDNIKNGSVLLIIDSYDELSRLKFQTKLFNDIFMKSPKYICATRPEMYKEEYGGEIEKIKDAWDYPTIKEFIINNTNISKEIIHFFLDYINKDNATWLRTPRYLKLFLDVIENYEGIIESNYENIINTFQKGEYYVMKRILNLSINRIHSIYKKYINEAEIIKKLHELAKVEVNLGALSLEDNDEKEWEVVKNMTDFILCKFNSLKFKNATMLDFFLTENITKSILNFGEIEFDYLWSNNLVKYLTQCMIENSDDEKFITPKRNTNLVNVIAKIKQNMDIYKNKKNKSSHFNNKYVFINLFNLLIQLKLFEKTNKKNNDYIEFKDMNFSDMYLDGLDLSCIYFEDCKFTNSDLSNSILDKSFFKNTSFFGTKFCYASAINTTFESCDFDFNCINIKYFITNSNIYKMIIQGTIIKDCINNNNLSKKEFIDQELMEFFGAKLQKSRYVGGFGEKFFEHQKKFLGKGLEKAEDFYVKKIQEVLDIFKDDNKFLIDVMAGGSSKRFINNIFPKYSNLYVLAIDKDTTSLKEILRHRKTDIEFNIKEQEIKGAIGLENIIKVYFEESKGSKINLVIGKKAIHEMCREQQISFMNEISNFLSKNGRLILFTDSPKKITKKAYNKLQNIISIIKSNNNLNELKKILINDLYFSDDYDSCAIFSNLWVILKDWANDNIHEVNNRYFSSRNEIIKWAKKSNMKLVSEYREMYKLQAKIFNEVGINKVDIYLKKNNIEVLKEKKDINKIKEFISGNDRYNLFCEFAEKHLWNVSMNEGTLLGKKLNAGRESVNFSRIDERLSIIDNPDNYGVYFNFSVHIFDFCLI